jgi:hypothetical protein
VTRREMVYFSLSDFLRKGDWTHGLGRGLNTAPGLLHFVSLLTYAGADLWLEKILKLWLVKKARFNAVGPVGSPQQKLQQGEDEAEIWLTAVRITFAASPSRS